VLDPLLHIYVLRFGSLSKTNDISNNASLTNCDFVLNLSNLQFKSPASKTGFLSLVNGIVAIMDMKQFGLLQLRHSPPAHLQKVVQLIQDCFPARFKAIHIVNEPSVFGILFGIVKRFLNEKLQERIHFHGCDYKSLHKYIPSEILPEEYGGMQSAMNNSDFVSKMLERDEQFKNDMTYGFGKKCGERDKDGKLKGKGKESTRSKKKCKDNKTTASDSLLTAAAAAQA